MKTFVFGTTVTNSLKITVYACTNENAFRDLSIKIDIMESMRVQMPRIDTWFIETVIED